MVLSAIENMKMKLDM